MMEGWKARVRALFRRGTEERELAEEMEFHLAMEAGKLEAEGMSPEAARREARVRFGGVERMKERTRDARGSRTLEDTFRDLLYAVRTLRRDRVFTAGAGITLALGIGAVTAVFSLVDGVLLRPLPYADPSALVEIRELGEGRRFFPSFPNFLDWRERSTSFSSLTAVQPLGAVPVLDAGDPVRVPVVMVAADFTETLGVPLVLGRDLDGAEHQSGGPPAAMVSHRFWQERLGAATDLESVTFTAFGSSYPVVGVLPAGFELLYKADIYISAERWPGTIRSAHAYRVVGRLAEGVTLAAADAEMDALTARMKEEYGGETNAETAQLRALNDVVLGDHRRPLGLLLAASALVLLVACANVASTLLARGATRRRELAVRTSLGAGRPRLIRQLLTENLVLAGLACAVGVGLAWLAVEGAVAVSSGALPRLETVGLDGRAVGVSIAMAVMTVMLFGLFPALRLSRGHVAQALKAGGRGGSGRRGRGWDGLIGLEVALAVVLLVGAGLLVKSLRTIVLMDAGWEAQGVVQMSLAPSSDAFEGQEEALAFLEEVRSELGSIPGVTSVGMGTFGPLDGGTYTAPAHDPETGRDIGGYAGWRLVGGDYFQALSIPLLRGRLFQEGDQGVAVVNETLATNLWGDDDPIGRMIVSNYDGPGRPREVVGVVAVAKDWRVDFDDQMEMFVPWRDRLDAVTEMRFLVKSDLDAGDLIPAARARTRALNARVPVEFTTLESELAASLADRRFVASILSAFAAVGLLLALLGIAGVVSYSVAQRRREIGIRMALGAEVTRVRSEIRREALIPTLAGLGAGLLGASLLVSFMEALLYDGVPPRDPLTFGGVALAFLAVCILAGDIPARRAAGVHPSEVLREE